MKEKRNVMINLVKHLRSTKKITLFSSDMNLDQSFMKIIDSRLSLKDIMAINTTADGNCFYYSVSFLLFSTEIEYWKIKIGVVFVLLEYSDYFISLLKDTGSPQTLSQLIETAIKDYEWANEYIELACSILVKRPVFTYTFDIKTSRACDHLFCASMDYYNNKPLTIGFYDYHFVSLVKKQETGIVPIPLFNQFMGRLSIKLEDY